MADITVLSTLATEQAYRDLLPDFERATGHKVTTSFTGTVDVKKRIAAGEAFDLLIMASDDIDAFLASGALAPGSRADLASSGVGVAVRAGAAKPDIGTVAAFRPHCWPPAPSAIPPARAATMSSACSTVSASPTRSSRSCVWRRPAPSSAA